MNTFTIIAGVDKARSGTFGTSWGRDQIVIDYGLFKKQKLSLQDVTLSTDGLQSTTENVTRFRLRHIDQEWVCDCPDSNFTKLRALIRRSNSDTETAEEAIEESAREAWRGVVFFIIVVALVVAIYKW